MGGLITKSLVKRIEANSEKTGQCQFETFSLTEDGRDLALRFLSRKINLEKEKEIKEK